MIEILAAAAEGPTAAQTYAPAAMILVALGGWKGIAQGILWLQGRNGNGNGNGKRTVDEKACDRRHAEEAKYRALETGQLVKSLDTLTLSVNKLNDRFDKYVDEHHS